MKSLMSIHRGVAAAMIVLAAALHAQHIPSQPVVNQFGVAGAPPADFLRDTVRGEMISYETLMAKPIHALASGAGVAVANDADGRLVILNSGLTQVITEIVLGQGICAIAERPLPNGGSELWVTLRHQAGIAVINTNGWLMTHLLRADVPATVAGARFADSPGGITFSTDFARAFVASTFTDHLVVFDAVNKVPATLVSLKSAHNGRDTFMNEPFAVTRCGNRILVASYRSGNNSLAEVMPGPLSENPNTATSMSDLSVPMSTRQLPDFDVMVIDETTLQITHVVTNTGTVLNGLVSTDPSGRFVVSNIEAFNAKFIGAGGFPEGRVVRSRLTYVDISSGGSTSQHSWIETENLVPSAPSWVNVVQPTDMVVDSQSRVFVAGYGSSNIGVFSASGGFIGVLPAESGPLGLALSPSGTTLYCFNRAANSVTSYDLSTGLPTTWSTRMDLVDQTFEHVKHGRQVFLDSSFSMRGTTSCGSCHQHLRNDGTAWQLSSFYDNNTGFTFTNQPANWKDPKGIQQTQSLLSLEESLQYHWRGEQEDIEDFADVFPGLLKGTEPSAGDFADMKAYIFSGRYPTNPFQMLNRDLSTSAFSGADLFLHTNADAIGACNSCHALPTGSDNGQTEALRQIAPGLATKTAQLRGLFEKLSDLANLDTSGSPASMRAMLGVGLLHLGTFNSFEHFVSHFFTNSLGAAGVQQVIDFLHEFDTGIAPAANWSEFLTARNPAAGAFLVSQAEAGNCDVAVQGWYRSGGVWHVMGLVYDVQSDAFVAADSTFAGGTPQTLAQLSAMTANGNARWLLLGVPPGSGERFGIDRDRDLLKDLDEIALGTDPTHPDSDGDGYWDGYEGDPLNPGPSVIPVAPPAIVGTPAVEWSTTTSIKITYRTDVPSISHVVFGPVGNVVHPAGDPTTLPTGSRRWKREHTVFLRRLNNGRVLDAGTIYRFRIVTLGQNGVSQTSSLFSSNTLRDELPNGMVVKVMSLTPTQVSGGTQWDAQVKVTRRDGVTPVASVNVSGVFTLFGVNGPPIVGGQTILRDLPTNSSGDVVFSWTVNPGQSLGEGVSFDIPSVFWDPNSVPPGSFSGVDSPDFSWPESGTTGLKVIL